LIVGGLLLFVGLPLVLGAFAAIRSVYFVGSDDAGFVTIYRGLPYDLPLGVDLYDTNYTSSATRDRVPRERRKPVFDHKLRSRDDAYELVRDLERQQVGR
jgi:protein phosphatase